MGGTNTYVYALDNPVSYSDRFGLRIKITVTRNTRTSASISGRITTVGDRTTLRFDGVTLENRHPSNPALPIPQGAYAAFTRVDRNPHRVELLQVPNATDIQIHPGNTISDLKGCIAPGTIARPDFVGNSRAGMNQINDVIAADGSGDIQVVVRDANAVPGC